MPADTSQPSRSDPGISPPRSCAGAFPTAWQRPPLTEPHRRRLTLLAMCVATFMIQLDVTIVTVALPSIQRDARANPRRPRVGDQRLRAQPGRAHPGQRGAGRPLRAAADLPGRRRRLRGRLGRLRPVAHGDRPRRLPRAAGGGRRGDAGADAVHHHRHVPARDPGGRHRHLGGRRRDRLRRRPGGRRDPAHLLRLGQRVLGQPPVRGRRDRDHRRRGPADAQSPGWPPRPPRRGGQRRRACSRSPSG